MFDVSKVQPENNLVPTGDRDIYYCPTNNDFIMFDEAAMEHTRHQSFTEAKKALLEYANALEGKLPARETIQIATANLLGAIEPRQNDDKLYALREGLVDTPKRVAKAWAHWTGGYSIDIAGLLKVFEDGAEGYDQIVIVKDIPIYSKCEHHLADIFGTATIAYIPNGKVVGLSKLSRVADAFARRLQVQERLTNQIADALHEHLQPIGVGVVIKARHMCMESRGLCQQGHHTITSALRGAIKDEPQVRAEFLQLAQ